MTDELVLHKPLSEMTKAEFMALSIPTFLANNELLGAGDGGDVAFFGTKPDDANVVASKRHADALSLAVRRRKSYVDAMKEHGYESEMHARPTKHGIEWYQILVLDGRLVFKTIYLQYNTGPGECPELEEGCPYASEEMKLMRCRCRWADIHPCIEDGEHCALPPGAMREEMERHNELDKMLKQVKYVDPDGEDPDPNLIIEQIEKALNDDNPDLARSLSEAVQSYMKETGNLPDEEHKRLLCQLILRNDWGTPDKEML